jgi:hypothetical protein
VSLFRPTSVHDIIPAPLLQYKRKIDKDDIPNEEVYSRTTVVKDIHLRKRSIAEAVISGGPGSRFITLPSGYKTFKELIEVVIYTESI